MGVVRYLVRMRADVRWTDERRWQIGNRLQTLLNDSRIAGVFVVSEPEAVSITEVKVSGTAPIAPTDPQQAAEEGFLPFENPFPPGTRKHKHWAKAYAEHIKWAVDYDSPLF